MISLMCYNSSSCMAALIFYTCVWIPYLELKRCLLRILGFIFPFYGAEESWEVMDVCLPVARFEDLKHSKWWCNRGDQIEEEVCSICLVELEKEDVVSQLQKCGHVFHMKCIEKWVERHHFTCPLCRSFLFTNVNYSNAKCGTTSHIVSSWLSF